MKLIFSNLKMLLHHMRISNHKEERDWIRKTNQLRQRGKHKKTFKERLKKRRFKKLRRWMLSTQRCLELKNKRELLLTRRNKKRFKEKMSKPFSLWMNSPTLNIKCHIKCLKITIGTSKLYLMILEHKEKDKKKRIQRKNKKSFKSFLNVRIYMTLTKLKLCSLLKIGMSQKSCRNTKQTR